MAQVNVNVTEVIGAPADAVWRTLRGFGDMERVLPEMVARCEVTGSGVGAIRVCTMQDGAKLNERLEQLDEPGRALTYSVADGVMPFTGYLSTIRVRDADGGGSEVNWSSTCTPAGMPEAEVAAMIEGVYRAAIANLARVSASTPA